MLVEEVKQECIKCLEKIAKLFDKEFGSVSTVEDLVNKCKELSDYLERWITDQKSNNEALQQLIDAQLEELSAAYEGLSALFEINKIISSVDEPWMILKNILKLLRNAVSYTVGIVKLEIDNNVYTDSYSTIDDDFTNLIDYFENILKENEKSNDVIFVDFEPKNGGYILIPLSSEIGKYGYLVLSNYKSNKFFTAGDKKIAEAVAQQILTAVNRYIMMQREIEKKRLEEQLQIARRIQQGLLPKEFPQGKWFDIGADSASAIQVGGDYYDVIEGKEGSILCCIADVSGKGLPAALIMSSFRSMFRLSGSISNDLKALGSQFDRMIHNDFEVGRFITSIIMKLYPDGRVEILNAGHDPLYVVRNNRIIKIESTGTPFGILGDYIYDVEYFQAEKGDILVAFTDGVVEARNINGEEFGFERLEEILLRNKYLKASDIVDKIMKAVFEFSHGTVQHDDTTVLVVKYE